MFTGLWGAICRFLQPDYGTWHDNPPAVRNGVVCWWRWGKDGAKEYRPMTADEQDDYVSATAW